MPALFTRMSTGPGLLAHAHDLERARDVGLHGLGVLRAAELLGDLGGALLVDVVDPHERARGDERVADLRADAVAAAGDERARDPCS